MELVLEILTGERKGKEIALKEGVKFLDGSRPYVLETEAFSLHLRLKEPCSEVALLMDGVDYRFLENNSQDDFYHYILKPKDKTPYGYETLFYNYFGVASMDVRITCNSDIQILCFTPIEVLARKLTAQQAEYMIEYILNESEGDLYSCFSATRLNAEYIDGGNQPKKVLEKLAKSIAVLEEMLPYIVNRPLTRVSSETRMQNGYQTAEIDEQGLVWLHENLSVLSETDDVDRAHLQYNDVYYLASEIQASVTIEHTDIYENRVIYDFLVKLKRFTIEMEEKLSRADRRSANKNSEGYISFFSMMDSWISKASEVEINTVRDYSVRVTRLIQLLDKRMPVSAVSYGVPLLTQKVKSNRFYTSIFKVAVEWHRFNKIDWRSRKMLLAIKSIPVLFEYYSVLRVRAELRSICEVNDLQLEANAVFSCLYRGRDISLLDQPEYWMVGHKNAIGARYLRTEIGSFKRTEAGTGFQPSNHKHSNRIPDIVIELKNNSGENILLVFDAKYSNMEKAYSDYLRDCGMKYIHGIHGVNGGTSPVQAMILICPAQSKVTLADMHAPPYGLFDSKTVFPVLGVQGVGLSADKPIAGDSNIGDTVKRLLDLAIDAEEYQG